MKGSINTYGIDKRKGGTLYKYLRYSGKKNITNVEAQASHGLILNLIGMENRPAIVEQKKYL